MARHALSRLSPNRQRRTIPLDDSPELAELAERVRTDTMVHPRTEAKDTLARLRKQLDPGDRTLLMADTRAACLAKTQSEDAPLRSTTMNAGCIRPSEA